MRQRYNPYGGAERIVARVLPALERAGAEVTLISRSEAGWGARRVIHVDPFHVGNLWRDYSFARAARAAWLREGFDVVQSHERIPGCAVYRAGDGVHRAWLDLRRAAGGRLEGLKIALNPYHRYMCRQEKRLFEHPRLRAVVCNSKMVRDEVQRRFRIAPEKLHVIYNGVDLEHFHPRQRERLRAAARAELGSSTRDMLFIFVGSGFARKGLSTLIAGLALTGNKRFRLLVVGKDRHVEAFRQHAKEAGLADRVKFAGGVNDVRPLYAAADCLILPSLYDPFGSAVLEALAMGVPAIVSTQCGAAEVMAPGTNGWICRPNDPREVARLMLEADRVMDAGSMEAAARATAERYGIDAMAKSLAELYVSLIKP